MTRAGRLCEGAQPRAAVPRLPLPRPGPSQPRPGDPTRLAPGGVPRLGPRAAPGNDPVPQARRIDLPRTRAVSIAQRCFLARPAERRERMSAVFRNADHGANPSWILVKLSKQLTFVLRAIRSKPRWIELGSSIIETAGWEKVPPIPGSRRRHAADWAQMPIAPQLRVNRQWAGLGPPPCGSARRHLCRAERGVARPPHAG